MFTIFLLLIDGNDLLTNEYVTKRGHDGLYRLSRLVQYNTAG